MEILAIKEKWNKYKPHTLLYYSNFEKKKFFLGDFFSGVVSAEMVSSSGRCSLIIGSIMCDLWHYIISLENVARSSLRN